MPKILVLYHPPSDVAAFDKYYRETHIPIAKRIPGLRSYTISTAPPQPVAGDPLHLIAELTFDSMADINTAFTSPEGQATIADLANFAMDGVNVLVYETEAV